MFAQITALVIFIAMFIFIVMDKIQRHIVIPFIVGLSVFSFYIYRLVL